MRAVLIDWTSIIRLLVRMKATLLTISNDGNTTRIGQVKDAMRAVEAQNTGRKRKLGDEQDIQKR